jgi:hypothetical protein
VWPHEQVPVGYQVVGENRVLYARVLWTADCEIVELQEAEYP